MDLNEPREGAVPGVIVARCGLDLGRSCRETTFDFAKHRRVKAYGMIVERTARKSP